MKKLSKKKIEQLIEATFYKYSYGIQIDIMNLSNIWKQAQSDYDNGLNINDTMPSIIETYRLKA